MKQSFTKHVGKQQYLYIVLAIIGMCFAGASLVLAEENATGTPGTSPQGVKVEARLEMSAEKKAEFEAKKAERDAMLEERKNAIEEKRAAFEAAKTARMTEMEAKRAEIGARIAERKAALEANVQERVKMLGDNLAKRFETVLTHLSDIIGRIETRLLKLESEGIDTSDAELLVAEAKQKLEEAKALVAELDVEVEYTVTSENPKTDWAAAKEEFRKVHTLIKEVRELLRQAVTGLKTERPEPTPSAAEGTATTTAE